MKQIVIYKRELIGVGDEDEILLMNSSGIFERITGLELLNIIKKKL